MGVVKATVALAGLSVALSCAPTSMQSGPRTGTMGAMDMRVMESWPKASREAAQYMMNKYGAPTEVTATRMRWGRTGQWKQTVVYNYEVQHDFPGPHPDVMQQWVDYRVPPDKFDDLAMYDGSVVVNRTNGEISARCDKEGANFLALNLANEVVTGTRSWSDARQKYGEQIMMMKSGRPAPYTERLMFTPPMGGTADPDRPLM